MENVKINRYIINMIIKIAQQRIDAKKQINNREITSKTIVAKDSKSNAKNFIIAYLIHKNNHIISSLFPKENTKFNLMNNCNSIIGCMIITDDDKLEQKIKQVGNKYPNKIIIGYNYKTQELLDNKKPYQIVSFMDIEPKQENFSFINKLHSKYSANYHIISSPELQNPIVDLNKQDKIITINGNNIEQTSPELNYKTQELLDNKKPYQIVSSMDIEPKQENFSINKQHSKYSANYHIISSPELQNPIVDLNKQDKIITMNENNIEQTSPKLNVNLENMRVYVEMEIQKYKERKKAIKTQVPTTSKQKLWKRTKNHTATQIQNDEKCVETVLNQFIIIKNTIEHINSVISKCK